MKISKNSKLFFMSIILLMVGIGGCATLTPEPTPVPPTSTNVPPTETPLPTNTPVPPTATATEMPTLTASATSPPSPSGSIGGSVENAIKIYFVLPPVGGATGCDATAIGVGIGQSRSSDIANDANIALKQLLSNKSEYAFGLYNPLSRSNIKVGNVKFDRSSGLITVNLRGTYSKPKDDCDNTRVKAQVWSTVKQFRGVKATNIYLNGIPFGDRVSNDK
jgi:hypothetical protein